MPCTKCENRETKTIVNNIITTYCHKCDTYQTEEQVFTETHKTGHSKFWSILVWVKDQYGNPYVKSVR